MTMTGTIHNALMRADTNRAVRMRPAPTAAATVQSSPMMKWYQKRPKATIHPTILFTSGRRLEPERPPAFDRDVGRRRQYIKDEQAEDRAVAGRPINAETLERPEGSEGREQDSDHELKEAARDTSHESLQ